MNEKGMINTSSNTPWGMKFKKFNKFAPTSY